LRKTKKNKRWKTKREKDRNECEARDILKRHTDRQSLRENEEKHRDG